MARTRGRASIALPDREHQSVSVRKISNGYVASHSADGPGGYSSTETFHPSKPVIKMTAAPKGAKPSAAPAPKASKTSRKSGKGKGHHVDQKMGRYC